MKDMTKTHSDRVRLANALWIEMDAVDRVRLELLELLEEGFDYEEGRTSCNAPDHVARVLELCSEALYNFLLEYWTCTGSTDYQGVETQVERAKLLLERHRVSELMDQLFDKAKNTPDPAMRATLEAVRKTAADLPDAEAISLLESAVA